MKRATFTTTRLILRALTILVLFTEQGLHWFLGWLWLLIIFAGRKRRQAWFGRCVLALFRRLSATFIKVGQIMSTRPDLLPDYITHALEHLQDDVGPFPFSHVVRTIEEDLHRPLREIFAEFAPVPMASASVAQVHKARLPDGRVVAVKVRRPNLVELCTFDLAIMRTVARWLGKLPPLVRCNRNPPSRNSTSRVRATRLRHRSTQQPALSRELPRREGCDFPRGDAPAFKRSASCACPLSRGPRSWAWATRDRIPNASLGWEYTRS